MSWRPPLIALFAVAPNGDEVRVDVTMTNDDGGFQAIVPPEQFE